MKKQDTKKPAPAQPGTALAAPVTGNLPEYLRPDASQAVRPGLENMDRSDMTLPRLGLCQSMSPQRKGSDPKFIKGLEEGQFFNTITGVVFGTNLKLIPLLFYKTRIRFASKKQAGGGILCQAQDNRHGVGDPGGSCDQCPLALFGKSGEAPVCSQFFNYVALVLPREGSVSMDSMVVASFKSTGLKTARDFNALVRLRGTALFAGVYEFNAVEVKNKEGAWFQPVIKPAGWVPQEIYQQAAAMYQAVRETQAAGRLRVDAEDLAPAEGEEASNEI